MKKPVNLQSHLRAALRAALSHQVANGVVGALGLLLITALVQVALGSAASSAAAVGVIVAIPPDMAAPRRGKLLHMLPAPLLALPLFFLVQLLHGTPWALGLVLVPASFLAFLCMAWGKRGAPVAISAVFALVFSMAVPASPEGVSWRAALATSCYFGLGALLYLPWAVLANHVLNMRYRVQMIADVLLSLAALMRLQAHQFAAVHGVQGATALLGDVLGRQAALADQLQAARDIVLESPRTPRRLQLAGMLLCVLEMRDHLVACGLDLEQLRGQQSQAPVLERVQHELRVGAQVLEQLADAMLLGRRPALPAYGRADLDVLLIDAAHSFTPEQLAHALENRMRHVHNEVGQLVALARGDAVPDLALVRASWQVFVSPVGWGWAPFVRLWRWRAAPLRHAMRAALAIGVGFAISQWLPWGGHAYWVVLTIIVVLRGSLAQTLERRNARVAGTLLGCVLASALLAAQLPHWGLILCVTVAQALAHAFAVRRYLVTAVAATVLGLVQAHLLGEGTGGIGFALFERLTDTLLGAGLAWIFAYVLPSWERHQLPALVRRTLLAQAQHAREALGLMQLQAMDNSPELAWRLARREAYDSLSALVQATGRALKEPRAVRPPLAPLKRMQAYCYQLLAQLTSVKTMLLLRRGYLRSDEIEQPLQEAVQRIQALLLGQAIPPEDVPMEPPAPVQALPPLAPGDLTPWLLRRLRLAQALALQLRQQADLVRAADDGGDRSA